jgi:3-deoxy-D-manno-octulosonate 8-phosphate phosphatase (KDO 8-P phosphatase)
VLLRVGLAGAPADAVPEVRDRVHRIAPSVGGAGAAREFLELILRAQGRWDAIVQSFVPEAERA